MQIKETGGKLAAGRQETGSTPQAGLRIHWLSPGIISLALILSVVIGGCTGKPDRGISQTDDTAGASTLSKIASPPYPGNYKTVLVDGAEMRQGRFQQGLYGGTLVRSIIASDPKTFNYWTASDTTSTQLASLMFSGLVTTDPYTGDVIPDLAAQVTVEPDHLTYVTRLRKGLKWSDGKPITSADVAFTWNTLIAQGYGNSSLRDVTTVDGKSPKVTIVDELTNKFVTARPFVPFIRQLGIAIAPKHIIERVIAGKDGRRAFDRFWSQEIDPKTLVTSGPFVLSRFTPSQRVEFTATRNFYMVDPEGHRLPYLDKIIFQFVPDVVTNLLKFKGGEINITTVRNRDAVELLKMEEKGNFKLHNLGQDTGTIFMMFNMNRSKSSRGKPFVDPVKAAWFNDVNFRQAVNHALNRDRMVANYFKGIGFPQYTAEAPTALFFDASLKAFPQDYALSGELLKKSGFEKKADGFLYDKSGHKVEFDMVAAAGGTLNEAIGGMIASDLKNLGIKVNFAQMEWNALIDKVDQSKDWEACLFSLSGDPLEPNNGANVWKSDGRLHLFDQRTPDAAGKIKVTDARPWEKRLDELFNQGVGIFDKEKRKGVYAEYQKIVYDQAPLIYLVSPMDIVGARNTIGNYQPTQLSQSVNGLHNLEEIYISAERKNQ